MVDAYAAVIGNCSLGFNYCRASAFFVFLGCYHNREQGTVNMSRGTINMDSGESTNTLKAEGFE